MTASASKAVASTPLLINKKLSNSCKESAIPAIREVARGSERRYSGNRTSGSVTLMSLTSRRATGFLVAAVILCAPTFVRARDHESGAVSSLLKLRLKRGFDFPETKLKLRPPDTSRLTSVSPDTASPVTRSRVIRLVYHDVVPEPLRFSATGAQRGPPASRPTDRSGNRSRSRSA